MRLAFVGSPPFAAEAFQALLRRAEGLVGLVTAPRRPAGRGLRPARNDLAEAAAAAGLPVLAPESAAEPAFLEALAALRPDLGVVVSFGQILRPEFLAIPSAGCINLHASLLPRWRGASPVQAAILAGDTRTGVSVQRVVARLDAGPVLARREVPIGPRETAPELSARLARAGAELLVEFLDRLGEGPMPAGDPQDETSATMCRRLRREDGRMDWSRSAAEADRRVRAMAGWPVAETALPDGEALKVLSGEPAAEPAPAAGAGTILDVQKGILVRCGVGAYRILTCQRAGGAAMSGEAFARGARLRPGMSLQP